MKRALIMLLTLPMLLVAAACDQASDKKDQPTSTQPAVEHPIADEDLAVPADFEDEASKTITASNYKSELDKIDGEIATIARPARRRRSAGKMPALHRQSLLPYRA
jgi:hypothetical protein